MTDDDGVRIADVRDYAGAIKRNKPRMDMGGHGHGIETIREDDYKGHHIVVRTRYEIEVDGKPITGHMALTNDGRIHYHAVPNVSFPSAIALVRQLIDAFPDDFPTDGSGHHGGMDM